MALSEALLQGRDCEAARLRGQLGLPPEQVAAALREQHPGDVGVRRLGAAVFPGGKESKMM